MKRNVLQFALVCLMAVAARASDAESWATAGSRRGQRNGTAAAGAHYDGRVGFARTQTRSGPVSVARGVAVGVDENGLSLSVSNAIAPRFGPALATTFNMSIGRDGQVSAANGVAVADGPLHRSATAGGGVSAGGHGRPARVMASGRTDPLGRVHAETRAQPSRRWGLRHAVHAHRHPAPRRLVRVHHHRSAPREVRRYQRVRW